VIVKLIHRTHRRKREEKDNITQHFTSESEKSENAIPHFILTARPKEGPAKWSITPRSTA